MGIIDLRSDTVTRPGAAMRRAMAAAEVGDDVFGDDPTVNRLQERVAELLGKEAALFVPSGTMGNQLAIRAHAHAGDQVVLEDGAHIYRYEAGAPVGADGRAADLRGRARGHPRLAAGGSRPEPADNFHCAPPRLVCLENTHNRAGGRILPQANVVAIAAGAHARGLRVHLDGARLWHAHVATGLALAELAAPVDTVSVCFSKALGAPVGSVLAGDRATVATAHRFRKMFGGGMRQAGILAAACLHALDHHLERLAEDHAAARRLATGLDNPHLKVNHPVDTNIVIIDVQGAGGDRGPAGPPAAAGVLAVGFGPGRVRLVPNLDTPPPAVTAALAALNRFPGVGR